MYCATACHFVLCFETMRAPAWRYNLGLNANAPPGVMKNMFKTITTSNALCLLTMATMRTHPRSLVQTGAQTANYYKFSYE